MSQRAAVTSSTENATADRAAQRVQPEQREQQPALAQNLLRLQQAVGNRATQGFLSAGLLQAKLRIGPAGDSFEHEADRMADAVLRMPEPGTGANTPQVAQAHSGNVQRVCSECEEELRRQPMEEEEEDEELLQKKASTNASPLPVNAGVESHIASLRGSGRPLPPALRSFFEPRFNHDFSNVRVHTDGTAAESAHAIKARAFTVGRDIAFGTGQYAPDSRSGRQLLAHELTHTIQQTPLVARRKPFIQRQPDASTDMDSAFDQTESESPIEGPVEQPEQVPAGPESEPETPVPGETPAPGLIVSDETSELGPGQIGKSTFLAELRSGICAAIDEPLSGTQYTAHNAEGCPTIELYLRIYDGYSAERIEQDLMRFMPEAAGIIDARKYIPLMAARARRSVEVWVRTGEITGVPEGLPTNLPGLSAIGRVLFKTRNGGQRGKPNPQAVQTQLGAGRPMNGSVGSRMGSAFGRNFSNVRVHTDATASQLSNRFNARAFTVGNHVAFGTGQYRPGTMMGDALIAHELAHTVQQGGQNTSVAPMEPGNTGTTALEKDADLSAVGAMALLWGGAKSALAKIAQNAVPRLRSGLSLQRCDSFFEPEDKTEVEKKKPVPVPPPKKGQSYEDWLRSFPPRTVPISEGDQEILDLLPNDIRSNVGEGDCADVALVLRDAWLKAQGKKTTFKVGPKKVEFSIGKGVSKEELNVCKSGVGSINFQEDVHQGERRIVKFYQRRRKNIKNLKTLIDAGLKPGDLFVWDKVGNATGFQGHVQTVQAVDRDKKTITWVQGTLEGGTGAGVQGRTWTFKKLTGRKDGNADIADRESLSFVGAGPFIDEGTEVQP